MKTFSVALAAAFLTIAPIAQAAFIVEMSESRARELGRIPNKELVEKTPAPPTIPVWQVEVGKSLRETLAEWARQANWEIHWDTKEDFVLLAPAQFKGKFEEAVSRLLSAINLQGHAFRAEAYTGNKVLRIYQQ